MKRLLLGLLALALAAGLIVLLLVPAAQRQYRRWQEAKAVDDYRRAVAELDAPDCDALMAQAREYNAAMDQADLTDAFDEGYDWGTDAEAEPLDVAGGGVIAVLELPKLGLTLPVYRGTSREALETSVAHLQGSSLPVGGKGAHCVLAGLADGRFAGVLDGMDRLMPGECFRLEILREAITYEVQGLELAEPGALGEEAIDPETDACTLVTAIEQDGEPMRLLVRARRVSRRETPLEDDTQLLPGWAARMIFAAPAVLAGVILLALVEALRRAARRRKVKRMRL